MRDKKMILFSDSAKEKIKALPQGSLLLTHLEAYQLYIDTTNEREVNLFNELVSNLENGNDCTSMIQQEKKILQEQSNNKKDIIHRTFRPTGFWIGGTLGLGIGIITGVLTGGAMAVVLALPAILSASLGIFGGFAYRSPREKNRQDKISYLNQIASIITKNQIHIKTPFHPIFTYTPFYTTESPKTKYTTGPETTSSDQDSSKLDILQIEEILEGYKQGFTIFDCYTENRQPYDKFYEEFQRIKKNNDSPRISIVTDEKFENDHDKNTPCLIEGIDGTYSIWGFKNDEWRKTELKVIDSSDFRARNLTSYTLNTVIVVNGTQKKLTFYHTYHNVDNYEDGETSLHIDKEYDLSTFPQSRPKKLLEKLEKIHSQKEWQEKAIKEFIIAYIRDNPGTVLSGYLSTKLSSYLPAPIEDPIEDKTPKDVPRMSPRR